MAKLLAVVLFITMLVGDSYAAEKSLREILVEGASTYVIPIDDRHTYIYSGHSFDGITRDLINGCPSGLEVNNLKWDDITRDYVTVWRKIDASKELVFSYRRMHHFGAAVGSAFLVSARCPNEFEIIQVEGSGGFTSKGYIYQRSGDLPRGGAIIKHEKPQPNISKSIFFNDEHFKTLPPDGKINLKKINISSGFFSYDVKKPKEAVGVFFYVTELCKKNGGHTRFIVDKYETKTNPKTEKAYLDIVRREVDAMDAIEYVVNTSYKPSSDARNIFYVCEGNVRFIARNDFFNLYFEKNRGADEIKFISLPKKPEPIKPNQDQIFVSSDEEKIAIEVATSQSNIFKVIGLSEYAGIYNNKDKSGCDLVTVEKTWDTSFPNPRIDTYNYRICNGVITKASETGLEGLPQNINSFIEKMARIAKKHGKVNADFQGFTVKAQSLRDKDQCLVEVKIFKDINLIETRVVDGCK
jgi:hypothetical protein